MCDHYIHSIKKNMAAFPLSLILCQAVAMPPAPPCVLDYALCALTRTTGSAIAPPSCCNPSSLCNGTSCVPASVETDCFCAKKIMKAHACGSLDTKADCQTEVRICGSKYRQCSSACCTCFPQQLLRRHRMPHRWRRHRMPHRWGRHRMPQPHL